MIRLEALSVAAGDFRLGPVDLEVAGGEYFVLLGPSGHGKTVLLEAVLGLRRAAAGRVLLGGREVTGVPPERRGAGWVAQGASLFPHLSVFENVAFPLRVRGAGAPVVAETVPRLLALVGASHLAARQPGSLSGGEAQRVALARALAPSPAVLVLDEPLASLDASSQQELQQVLRSVHRSLGTTTLHVEHDQARAAALADRIGVLVGGKLLQVGPPEETFRRPSCAEVARFLGIGNVLAGECVASGAEGVALFRARGLELRVVTPLRGPVRASIRPEEILVSTEPLRSSAAHSLPGRVAAIDERGPLAYVTVDTDAGVPLVSLVLRTSVEALQLTRGSSVHVTFKAAGLHVF